MKPTITYRIQYFPGKEWSTYEVSNSIRNARKMLKEFSRDIPNVPWRIIRHEITETIVEETK